MSVQRNFNYQLQQKENISTPSLVLFDEVLHHNIVVLDEMVGVRNVFLHVKTHKAIAMVRLQMAAGVAGFKCSTLSELEMVLAAGANDAILAFPLMQKTKLDYLISMILRHPEARVSAIISKQQHLDALEAAASRAGAIRVSAMLDLNVGMDRTGVRIGSDAMALYRSMTRSPLIQAAGIHAYDGHITGTQEAMRAKEAKPIIEALKQFQHQLREEDIEVVRTVAGGSVTFPYYAREEGMYGSPGTCAYWDANYLVNLPDMAFCPAAVVHTQIIDRDELRNTVTTDLGSKAIASDYPVELRAHVMEYPNAQLIHQSEEHGVFLMENTLPCIGDYMMVIPGHICPTVAKYPGAYVVDGQGSVIDYFDHTARDRK